MTHRDSQVKGILVLCTLYFFFFSLKVYFGNSPIIRCALTKKNKLYRKYQLKLTGFYALFTCERFIYKLIIHSIANMIIDVHT